MAQVKPFKAVRPIREQAATIAALPYDVQSEAEARKIVASNPLSFLAIDEPVVNFPEGTDLFDLKVYQKAGALLDALQTFGIFKADEAEHFYLYELTMAGRVQNGLVGCASIDDYLNGIVKEHESTRVDKEVDRINHVRGCSAQTGPIFLAHHFDQTLAEIYARAKQDEPLFDFVADDGVRHRGFVIDDADAEAVTARFAELGRVYIADGHHRVAAAAEVAKARRNARGSQDPTHESDYFLAVLFADTELKIWPYERVVHDLNGLTEGEFLAELRARFDVQEITSAQYAAARGQDPYNTCNQEDEPGHLTAAQHQPHAAKAPSQQPDNPEQQVGSAPLTILGNDDPAAVEAFLRPTKLGEFCTFVGGRWYRCHVPADKIPQDVREGLEVSLLQRQLFAPVLGIADPRRSPRIDFVGGIRGLAELERRCATDCAAAFALSPTSIDELFAVADADLLMPPKSTWFEPKLRSGLFIHQI